MVRVKSITTRMAEKLPKARIGTISDKEVATKAQAVVKEVTKMPRAALLAERATR